MMISSSAFSQWTDCMMPRYLEANAEKYKQSFFYRMLFIRHYLIYTLSHQKLVETSMQLQLEPSLVLINAESASEGI